MLISRRADLATGKTFFSLASGVISRPWLSLFFLIYTQSDFVTSPCRKVERSSVMGARRGAGAYKTRLHLSQALASHPSRR